MVEKKMTEKEQRESDARLAAIAMHPLPAHDKTVCPICKKQS